MHRAGSESSQLKNTARLKLGQQDEDWVREAQPLSRATSPDGCLFKNKGAQHRPDVLDCHCFTNMEIWTVTSAATENISGGSGCFLRGTVQANAGHYIVAHALSGIWIALYIVGDSRKPIHSTSWDRDWMFLFFFLRCLSVSTLLSL